MSSLLDRQERAVEWGWNGDGMLVLSQDQYVFTHRTGDDKQPALVIHAHQLPAVVAALVEAAAEEVPEVHDEIQRLHGVSELLQAFVARHGAKPLPEPPSAPQKKKGAAV